MVIGKDITLLTDKMTKEFIHWGGNSGGALFLNSVYPGFLYQNT